MSKLRIIMNVDEEMMPHVPDQLSGAIPTVGVIEGIGAIPQGMESGKTSVCMSVKLPNGTWVFAETSLKMFQMAAAAFTGKYGNETDDPTLIIADGLIQKSKGN